MTQTSATPLHRLRRVLFAALAVVLLSLTGAQFIATGQVTERQLLEIESSAAFARLRRLHHALGVLEENLATTTTDWAQWGDVHRYAAGEYPDFPTYNLVASTYTGLKLDFIGVVDSKGRILYAQRLDDAGAVASAPEDVLKMLGRDGPLSGTALGQRAATGLIDTSFGVLLVSSQPITNYEGEVLGHARFVMGRSLERRVRQSLERVTGEKLEAFPPGAAYEALGETKNGEFGDVLHLREGELTGVTTMADLWGRPVVRLRLQADRPTQALVRASHRRLLIAGLIIAAALCATVGVIIRSRVVAPIERLAAAVDEIGERTDAAARVPVERASIEFETLSRAINSMLQQREQQQALRRDRDAAIEANRLKSEFLATMSHEIRTPMNGVLGMCELLQRTPLDAKQQRLADTIVRSARSLLDILSDILDFSKIESGRLELEQAPFAPAEMLATVTAPFASAAQAKGLAFHTRVAADVPSVVVGDPYRLRQVLNNLLANAVKFTERGSITVSCAVASTDRERVILRYSVADTGIGVAPSAQQHIFDAFAQAESSTTRRFGGTGLGLAIVKRLALLMGGDVELTSEHGRGSTFTLSVPLQRAPDAAGADAAAATGAFYSSNDAPEVLLAEDNDVNREVLQEMLELFGCRVTTASDGAEALEKAKERRFDVVLMDCHMPVMDGLTATEQLRSFEHAAARAPTFVIALTADVTAENRTRCHAVGMSEVAAKPISHGRLRELIQRAMRASPKTTPRRTAAQA